MTKIILQLQGGLGNQLFQISFAKNLSKIINFKSKIKIDKSAFLFDTKYKRSFKFSKFNFENANFFEIIFLYLNRFIFKFFKKKFIRFGRTVFINDSKNLKYEKIFFKNNYKKNDKIYIVGFFQSEKYIQNTEFLKKYLKKIHNSSNVKKIQKKLNKSSVLIGYRFFEENIKEQIKFGGVEPFSFYNKNIKKFKKKLKNPKFFIMSTRQINNDKISTKNFYLIKQNNITDDEKILIMSFFKNFIISNSTFFFWGYFFSKIRYSKNNLICSKKFVNKDILNF